MPSLLDLAYSGALADDCRPWPRALVDVEAWSFAIDELAAERWTLTALWGEPEAVNMGLIDERAGQICVITLPCPAGLFPSVGRAHPPAIRLERAIRDLWGHVAVNAPDPRPWLDHGCWPARPPGAGSTEPGPGAYPFLEAEGPDLHQIPVGPVHAGIIEPGHFRFTASGETIVRLEERLGYVHKGTMALMRGADLGRGAKIAGRISGDSTLAYALAYARAVEAALEAEVPPRAVWLRALMAELERIANHLGDFGAICNDAAFSMLNAHCSILRERVLRTADASFGSRLMRDLIIPGGAARDLSPGGAGAVRELLSNIETRLPVLIKVYDNTSSLQDRTVGTGRLAASLARQHGAGGYIGRASGRAFDARRAFPYPPYETLAFEIPVREAGDVNARVWIRILEIEQSLSLITQILDRLPAGEVFAPVPKPAKASEGGALVEGFRGDIFAWIRLENGRIDRCALRDPSWFQWPLLEAAIEGNIVADFPLCNKSFNCSYSGHDL